MRLNVKKNVNESKNIWNSNILFSPTHFPTQGQWWSCPLMQMSHSVQWTVPGDFSNLQALHDVSVKVTGCKVRFTPGFLRLTNNKATINRKPLPKVDKLQNIVFFYLTTDSNRNEAARMHIIKQRVKGPYNYLYYRCTMRTNSE